MLNNIINNAMCYIMLYMLEWMGKGKYRIGTLRTRELRSLAFTEESLKGYIFIV